jgi:tetratricopeptide (TPR) repeat protein
MTNRKGHFLRIVWGASLLVSFILPVIVAAQGEVPITTKSTEARRIFIEARQLFDNIRFNEARDMFTKAIEKDKDFATAHLYRALTNTSAIDFQTHLQKAVALKSKVSEGERLIIEAVQAGSENNPVRAVQLWEQVVQKFPNDKRAHHYLAFEYFGRDEDDKAILQFEKAIQIDKNFAPAYNGLGYAYYEKENFTKAEEAFKNYVRLLPKEANPHDSLADLYLKMGRFDDAITNYRKAVELNPKFTYSQRKIGTGLIFKGKFEDGRAEIRKALAIEATPADKLADMGLIANSFLYEGKFEQALAEADNVWKAAVDAGLPEWQAGVQVEKSQICLEIGEVDKAEQCVSECRRVVTASALSPAIKENFTKKALFSEARIAAKRGDHTKAMARADEYKAKIDAAKDPKEMENHHALLGYIHFEKGEYNLAIDHLKQADKENPYTVFVLAEATSKAGDMTRATELFNKVAQWNEDSPSYALVRSKALMLAKEPMAEKDVN